MGEEKWIAELEKQNAEKNELRKQEEEKEKMELMRMESKKRKERSMQIQSTEFTKLQLKAVDEAIKSEIYKTPTPDEDGNFYVNPYGQIDAKKEEETNMEVIDETNEQNEDENENADEDDKDE